MAVASAAAARADFLLYPLGLHGETLLFSDSGYTRRMRAGARLAETSNVCTGSESCIPGPATDSAAAGRKGLRLMQNAQSWRQLIRARGPLRVLITGQCLGQAADGLAQISFAEFVVFEAGRGATPARIAELLAATLLPFSVVGPFAGVLIDRWQRRRVLIVMSVLRAGLTLLATATVITRSQPGAFAGVLLLLSTSRFVLAAKGAALPQTVARESLVPANAASAVAGMVASFLGAVGGSAFVGRSAAAGFVTAAVLYLAAGRAFVHLPDVGGGHISDVKARLRGVLSDVADGAAAIVRLPAISRPLLAVWLHRLLLGGGFVLLVLVADSRFHLKIAGYGLALAVTGVASFAGSLAAPACARRWPAITLLPVAFVPPAAAAYVAGTAPNLVVMVAALGATAFSFQLLKVLVDALVGGASPDDVRGRVFSVYDMLYNVAFVLAGLLMVPLWHPNRVTALFWWLGAAFVASWLIVARMLRLWPAATRPARARPSRRWWGRAVALAAGGLPVLAFPALSLSWLAWAALVPLLLWLRDSPTAREAGLRGCWAGAGYVIATEYWLAPVAGPGLLLLAFGLGALWMPWGWAAHRLLSGHPPMSRLLAAAVLLPSGWVAIEAVRSWQSLGGPWALLGSTQWNALPWLASASLGGVWLTSFLIVAVNVAITAVVAAGRRRSRAALAAVAAIAFAAGPLWFAVSPVPATVGQLRVAVVQPGIEAGAAVRLDREIALTRAALPQHPQLIVWGESSVGYDLTADAPILDRLVDLARQAQADILINVDARQGSGVDKTSHLVTPSGLRDSYTKTRLVPFGEYIPMRWLLGWLSDISKAAGQNRGRGHGPVVFDATGIAVGPLICFESTFPDMARREVALGADMIAYQTATSTFQGSWAQPQHAAVAAVRAVETGRPVVNAALTGTTAAFSATGHELLWLPAGRSGVAVVTLSLTEGRTPFDIAGAWMLATAAGIIASGVVAASLASSRSGNPP